MPGSERSYGAYLEARERDGLRRGLTGIEARDARTIRIGGEAYVNFAGNDYLALRFHPALINRAEAWAEEHGVGSGASRLVTGNLDLFAGIEAKGRGAEAEAGGPDHGLRLSGQCLGATGAV